VAGRRGRKPRGPRALTAAERQKRYRWRQAAVRGVALARQSEAEREIDRLIGRLGEEAVREAARACIPRKRRQRSRYLSGDPLDATNVARLERHGIEMDAGIRLLAAHQQMALTFAEAEPEPPLEVLDSLRVLHEWIVSLIDKRHYKIHWE
jgi:hypothetical protein